MTLAEREQYAKEFVNDIRHERGERRIGKLKRGIPRHPGHCTLAVSLPCRYANKSRTSGLVFFDNKEFHDPELAQFMTDFDEGRYPHLELPKTPIKMKKPGERKQTVIS